ncbi:uncharacterized protein LOC144027628 [Festucalex cinctus]
MEDTKCYIEAQSSHRHNKQSENGDAHQLMKIELPFVQQLTFSVKQEVPEPPHIKEEEVWFQGLDQAGVTQDCSTRVMRECGPKQSQLYHREGEIKIKAEPVSSNSTTKADVNQRYGFKLDSHWGPVPHVKHDVKSDSSDSDEAQQPLKSNKLQGSKWSTKPGVFCRVCSQRFQLWSHLRAHMKTHVTTQIAPTGEKTFSCSYCGKIYSKRNGVNMHVRMHAAVKQFSCSECGKRFTRNHYLINHMKVHTGEKPFPCSVCGKTFSCKGNLSKHMMTHTGEKPFSCSVCTRRFSTKTRLNAHMLRHTGEKPFLCSVCSERFAQKAYLETHMRTHTGETPYGCSVCGLKCAQKSYLVAHMRKHTDARLSCGLCNERFSHKQQASKHKCTSEHSGSK